MAGEWTHIVPGTFGGGVFTNLLFYCQPTGAAETYRVFRPGELIRADHHTWESRLRFIIPGLYTDSGETELVLYRGIGRHGELDFHLANGDTRQFGTRPDWTSIVPGQFSNNWHTELLLYNQTLGLLMCRMPTMAPGGFILRKGMVARFKRGWTRLVPGRFNTYPYTNIFCYQYGTGAAEIYALVPW